MKREHTILVADDEERFRQLLKASLTQKGNRVVTASSGREAIARLDDGIDLVLTALRMPDKDGIELLSETRRRGLTTPARASPPQPGSPHRAGARPDAGPR